MIRKSPPAKKKPAAKPVVKIKLKGSPTGVHNAVEKLATGGRSGGNVKMSVKFEEPTKKGKK
jgi:hypothetical protein